MKFRTCIMEDDLCQHRICKQVFEPNASTARFTPGASYVHFTNPTQFRRHRVAIVNLSCLIFTGLSCKTAISVRAYAFILLASAQY